MPSDRAGHGRGHPPRRQAATEPGPTEPADAVAVGTDPEIRHRLRHALRILTAARRRDDGGAASAV